MGISWILMILFFCQQYCDQWRCEDIGCWFETWLIFQLRSGIMILNHEHIFHGFFTANQKFVKTTAPHQKIREPLGGSFIWA